MTWIPNEETIILLHRYLEVMKERLPWILDIAEFIQGCTVEDLDPYGVGLTVYPRLVQVKLRGDYNTDVWYRQNMGLAVTDIVTAVRLRDGEQYEIFSVGGSSGAGLGGVEFANPSAQVGTVAVNGSATTAMRSDAAPPINQGIVPTWTGKHTFNGDADMNGNRLTWDADADTFEIASVDDEISWAIGGSVVGRRYSGGIDMVSGHDIYPDGNEAGVQYRLDASTTWDDHFDDIAALPAGWAWAGAPFTGTPATLQFIRSFIQFGEPAATRMFCYKAGAPAATGRFIQGMFASGDQQIGSSFGLRMDDGTDNNYVEFVNTILTVTPGSSQFQIRYRSGGGVVTTVNGSTMIIPDTWVIRLRAFGTIWTSWYVLGYLYGPVGLGGLQVFRQAASPVATHTWTPTRYGFIYYKAGAASYVSYIDAWRES